jgi:hypothetical protein
MFCNARPIDLGTFFVSIAVLLLTGYMAFLATWPPMRRRQRSRRALQCFNEGEQLRSEVPEVDFQHETRHAAIMWAQNVENWSVSTDRLLKGYSADASAAFLHDSGSSLDSIWYKREVAAGAHEAYETLQRRLNNLRGILERPEVYF